MLLHKELEAASLDASVTRALTVLIPAFRPNATLIDLVRQLRPAAWQCIVVVDDGSGPEYQPVFDKLKRMAHVEVVPHAVNLGKGSALKTGMNTILCRYPTALGVVTVDSDGQHDPEDVQRVAERFSQTPEAVILGVRQFSEAEVPLRSRIGNGITRGVLHLVAGQKLSDTQTGLRAIPRALAALMLKVTASGYEFELEMLLAVKHLAVKVVEQPIRTIYEPGNPSSHFQPLRDSMRIYFVLLRFAWIGALTAALDNLAFYLAYIGTGNILAAQVSARFVAVLFNYSTVRGAVFLSEERHRVLLPRYLAVVAGNAALSYLGIRLLHGYLAVPVLAAKVMVEALLFAANFVVQRDFVFTRKAVATDWDRYYKNVPVTAHLTRRYTQSVLIGVLRRFAGERPGIVEIGGANSCFAQAILNEIHPSAYHVIDNNEFGLSLLRERLGDRPELMVHSGDVLNLELPELQAGVVMSIGLIEHFSPADTRRAVRAHFDLTPVGGYVVVTFPTPTLLYTITRGLVEALGMWKFPDERPLRFDEVRSAVEDLGEIVYQKTLWPLVFTQGLLVIRKKSTPAL